MSIKYNVSVQLKLEESPDWLSHLEITRVGPDEVEIDVVKTNGLSYGHITISTVEFNSIADLILTAKE